MRINEELILKHFKNIADELTYAEYEMLRTFLDRVYERELKDSTYIIKIDATEYTDIKFTDLI